MNFLIKIVFRNLLRNRRRSLMTGSAIAAGALAILLFRGYANFIFEGLETNNVQAIGHLAVFEKGYFLFGDGNPAAYGIDHYQDVMALVRDDPVLRPMINVLTPTQSLVGIAGNFSGEGDASKTFLGVGLVPSDRDHMRHWDQFGIGAAHAPDPRLADGDDSHGLVGLGLARILGLCAPLAVAGCPRPPQSARSPDHDASAVNQDILGLATSDAGGGIHTAKSLPQIELLAATAGGAPNVVSLTVNGVEPQGVKELDDNFVAMNLALAQQLVYGRGEHRVTALLLQLHRTRDLPAARARLMNLFEEHHLDLEVRDFAERSPFYGQVVKLFSGIFLFIALVMGIIVLFAVVNTMTMNVMERINEIGTIRAMGVNRGGVRSQFILEGLFLGAVSATIGAVLAIVIAALVNSAGLTWIPPGNANPVPLRIDILGQPTLVVVAWLGLVLIATLAALIPASRAARLSVVDALRHI
jgi:putative ABC transport system permease protein